MNTSDKKSFIIAIISALTLLFLLIFISIKLTREIITTDRQQKQLLPVPTSMNSQDSKTRTTPIVVPVLKSVQNLPTKPPQQGFGIDTSSAIVKSSEREIQKLTSSLPYSKEFTTSNGVLVSIEIPSAALQDNRWTVLVQVFGIDYQVNSEMNSYLPMKQAFRESAAAVLEWMQQKKVNTDDIIILWGDKEFIENKAQEWLKSP